MNQQRIKSAIEQTILKPTATARDIEQLCSEALEHQFYGVCLASVWLPLAVQLLAGSPVKIITVAGFPLGNCSTDVKRYEIESAFANGAHEVDFVINLGWLKGGDHKAVRTEFAALVNAAQQKPLKVILETCLLTPQEIQLACTLAVECGIAFVKTSTGFSTGGATLEDIKLMHAVVQGKAGVKASGGIRDHATAVALLDAGANRLGTSSGIALLKF